MVVILNFLETETPRSKHTSETNLALIKDKYLLRPCPIPVHLVPILDHCSDYSVPGSCGEALCRCDADNAASSYNYKHAHRGEKIFQDKIINRYLETQRASVRKLSTDYDASHEAMVRNR